MNSISDSNNNNNNNGYNDTIFFKFWRNVVINRVIFDYVELYKMNRHAKIIGIKQLRESNKREYITNLVYVSDYEEKLLVGDFPDNGTLRQLYIMARYPFENEKVIPHSIEEIGFEFERSDGAKFLSKLPSSIHTLLDLVLITPFSKYKVPSSITSLSISSKSRIYEDEFYNIILPNVTKLDLRCLIHYSSHFPLVSPPSTFIPSSVTDLTIYYDQKYESNFPVIPSAVTKLYMFIGGYCNFKTGLIPSSVKELTINGSVIGINSGGAINLSEGSLPDSINKLTIICKTFSKRFGPEEGFNNIQPNSIPSSVTDLKIHFSCYPKSLDILPNNLTRLEITSKDDTNPSPLIPESIFKKIKN